MGVEVCLEFTKDTTHSLHMILCIYKLTLNLKNTYYFEKWL